MLRRPTFAASAFALVYLTFAAVNVHQFGVTVDEPSLLRNGDRVFHWARHGFDSRLMELSEADPPSFQSQFEYFPDSRDRFHYPVFATTVAAATSYVLHDRLGWLDVFEGHNFGFALIHTVSLFFYALYSSRLLGRRSGFFATLTLLLFPLSIGHSLNNPKDWPCAMLYAVAILAAGVGAVRGQAKHIVIGACFAGLAMGAKINGVIAIATLGAWTPIAYRLLYFQRRPLDRRILVAQLCLPLLAFAVFYVSWPWLYHGPLLEWPKHFVEYIRFMAHYGASRRGSFTIYPLLVVTVMTPPVVLVAGLTAVIAAWKARSKTKKAIFALILLWLAAPLFRVSLPHSNYYDANRHFIEYVPALCALAGTGVAAAIDSLRAKAIATGSLRSRIAVVAIRAAYVVGIVVPVVQMHPYESAYYNFLAGGLGGAQQRGVLADSRMPDGRAWGVEGDYWYASLRTAYEDARARGAEDNSIALCGPGTEAVNGWGRGVLPTFISSRDPEFYDAPYLIIMPRELDCCWAAVRQFESERPVLHRVERGGGLIYEILGAHTGRSYPITSPENFYTKRGRTCDALTLRSPAPSVHP